MSSFLLKTEIIYSS